MYTCEEYRVLISALIDDEIGEEDRTALMEHITVCDDCRAAMDDLFAIHEAMVTMEHTAPSGFADAVMAKVRETAQDSPERKVISFPHWKRWAGLAACCAVVVLGVFSMQSGFLSAEDTANCAAPQMAYSLDSTAESALTGGAEMPEAAAAAPRSQSDSDNGACVAESAADYASYGSIAVFAARVTTGSEIAAHWVEDTLGAAWESGTCYLLTAEQYTELVALLEQSGAEFVTEEGTEGCEFYQILAR